MTKVIFIKDELMKKIAEIAEKSPEREICGFGFSSDGHLIDEIEVVENISEDPLGEYVMSPIAMGKFIHDRLHPNPKRQILMVFHSHPKWEAYPSKTDIQKAYSGYAYIIYSNLEKRARAFLGSGKTKKKMEEIYLVNEK